MRIFKLKQEEKLSVKLTHQVHEGEQRRLDVYFSLPKEMGINKKTLSEEDYFHAGIKGRRAYFTEGLHLPLLHTRFAMRMKRDAQEYKANLNLFAYQYISALDTDINEIMNVDDNLGDFYQAAIALSENSLTILKKHRSNIPSDEKLLPLFANVDNYLSWYTEQSILGMLSKKPRHTEYSDNRIALLNICSEENAYRIEKAYNSTFTLNDPNRIANKMRLLRRLIEFAVIFKSETQDLGNITKKLVTGVATSLIMVIVLVLIIKTQGALSNLTSLMIFVLSVIYGLREVFKEDFKNMLWSWIRKGKPKWSRTLRDSLSNSEIAWQKVWLDYTRKSKLPRQAQELLAKRHSQNKQSAELLHYRIETKVSKSKFQAGYDTVDESIVFSLRPFSRYLERGTGKVFEQNEPASNREKIKSTAIERRYQINVVIALNQGSYFEQYERYRITLNRSGIIELESAGETKRKDGKPAERYSTLKNLLHFKRPAKKTAKAKKVIKEINKKEK